MNGIYLVIASFMIFFASLKNHFDRVKVRYNSLTHSKKKKRCNSLTPYNQKLNSSSTPLLVFGFDSLTRVNIFYTDMLLLWPLLLNHSCSYLY